MSKGSEYEKFYNHMEEALKYLPESINIRTMTITGISYNSDPTYIDDGITRLLVKENTCTEYELTDQKGMEVTLRINRITHH